MENQIFLVLLILISFWLGVLSYFLYQSIRRYNRLTHGTNKENLVEVLGKILEGAADNKKEIAQIKDILADLTRESVGFVQRIGILRFNPFADTGGDQSFVLTLLNGKDTGIVLTSLHNRGVTRWYGKQVKEGKGVDYPLSEEELKAIKQATSLSKIKIEAPKAKSLR